MGFLRSIWKTDKERWWKDIPYKWGRTNRGVKGESVFEARGAIGLEWMTYQVLKEGLVLDMGGETSWGDFILQTKAGKWWQWDGG